MNTKKSVINFALIILVMLMSVRVTAQIDRLTAGNVDSATSAGNVEETEKIMSDRITGREIRQTTSGEYGDRFTRWKDIDVPIGLERDPVRFRIDETQSYIWHDEYEWTFVNDLAMGYDQTILYGGRSITENPAQVTLYSVHSSTPLWQIAEDGYSRWLVDASETEDIFFGLDYNDMEEHITLHRWTKDSSVPLWTYDFDYEVYIPGMSARGSVNLSKDDSTLAVILHDEVSDENVIYIFDPDDSDPLEIIYLENTGIVRQSRISDDGNIIAFHGGFEATPRQRVIVYDRSTEAIRAVVTKEENVHGNNFSMCGSGDYIMVGYYGARVYKWNGSEYTLHWLVPHFDADGNRLYYNQGGIISGDGSTAIFSAHSHDDGWFGKIFVVDLDTPQELWRFRWYGQNGLQMVSTRSDISNDGSVFILGSWGDDTEISRDAQIFSKDEHSPFLILTVPGSVMKTAITQNEPYYAVAGGKRTHANIPGRGTHLYSIDAEPQELVPALVVEPGELDFGEVFVGYDKSKSILLKNLGTGVLDVADIEVDDMNFSPDVTSFSLKTFESQEVVITYAPDAEGPVSATLTIESNDPDSPHTVSLAGAGVLPPEIVVTPESFDIELDEGESVTHTMTVSNVGESDLTFFVTSQHAAPPEMLQIVEIEGSSGFDMGTVEKEITPNGLLDNDMIWLHYDGENANAIGLGAGGTFNSAVRFTSDELSEYYGIYGLFEVMVYAGHLHLTPADVSEFVLRVWEGGTFGNPGDLIYEADILDDLVYNNWTVHQLEEEIELKDEQEYWIGYKVTHTAGSHPAGCDGGPMVQGKGGWIGMGADPVPAAWDQLTDFGLNYNWNIRGGIAMVSVDWISFDIGSGVLEPDDEMEIAVTFDALDLEEGMYYANIIVRSNDPARETVLLPVKLAVGDVVGVDGSIDIPDFYTLMQNYPNPFNPSTTIRYGLPERSSVQIEIYNTLGQRIATLVDTELEAGYHEVEWYPGRAASGMYFYRIQAVSADNPFNRFNTVKSMILLK